MITGRCPLTAEQADTIEEVLCEEATSPWTLVRARPTDPIELVGYSETVEALQTAYERLRGAVPGLPESLVFGELADTDWREAYKLHLRPWQYGALRWVPMWERNQTEIAANEAAVFLDSGMAFGTGSHETTRLCARRLVDYAQAAPDRLAQSRVIDAGTGSGILALSAAALGARQIFAFDNDPDAIQIAEENAAENGLSERIEYAVGGVETLDPTRRAELVLANIHTAVLIEVPEALLHAVEPGGWLVLSGILDKERPEIEAAYLPAIERLWGTQPTLDTRQDGEWIDFRFTRPA